MPDQQLATRADYVINLRHLLVRVEKSGSESKGVCWSIFKDTPQKPLNPDGLYNSIFQSSENCNFRDFQG